MSCLFQIFLNEYIVNRDSSRLYSHPKYDSIDWQDDYPSKNLSIEEMDEILEERGGGGGGEDDSGGDDN